MTALASAPAGATLDVAEIRADFPILSRTVRDGKPLVYLDSGATSQRPRQVLDAEQDVPRDVQRRGPPRGARRWPRRPPTPTSPPASGSRRSSGADIGEVVFTKNATEAINLVAYGMGNAPIGDGVDPAAERFRLGPGDEVVVTEMEHHANLVPWQELCRRTGATLRWFAVTDDGRLDLPTWTT